MSLEEWYAYLNMRVFFWVSEDRLKRLLTRYEDDDHDVLVVDTASLVRRHAERLAVARFNTGASQRPNTPVRNRSTFTPVTDFAYEEVRRQQSEPIVEVTVEQGLADIADHVIRVEQWRGPTRVASAPP